MHQTAAATADPRVDRRVEAFLLSGDHGPAAVARFLPPASDPDYLPTLGELVRADLDYHADRGEPRRVEDYYWDFPALASAPSSAATLWRATDPAQTPAPVHTAQTKVRPVGGGSSAGGVSDADPAADPRLPAAGGIFGGFRLVEELGQGGFGRVFLAEEPKLADRRVVLKVTPRASNEPQRLARLQHTNIVPIQNAFLADGLFAVQMPFFGRQTLADLIAYVRDDGGLPRSGQVFSTTVARQSTSRQPVSDRPSSPGMPAVAPQPGADAPGSPDDPHPIREMLARMPYTDAVLWLVARIADGLAHAHARGILHLDLKPANVLFSDDGQPMLLDFNLGYDVGRQDRERIGGTWPYMAPEQMREYAGEPGVTVDARTDLYALGVLFFELLTGRQPFPPVARGPVGLAAAVDVRQAGAPAVRSVNPSVPPAVDAVVRKLLEADPAKRYQSADELRNDLERHRENRPLRHAPNPSVRELAAKWRRRNPRALPNILLAACAAAVVGLGAAAWQMSATRAQDRAARTAGEFHAALVTLRVDLSAPEDGETRRAAVKAGADWLTKYGVPADPGWADVPLVRDLPAGDRAATADALGELAVLMAHAEMLDTRSAQPDARTEPAGRAAGWNRTAERWFATTSVPAAVWDQRAEIAAAAGDDELKAKIPAERPAATTRTDLYVRAVGHIAAGEFGRAVGPLTELTDREKDLYAAHFALAYCYQKTGQHLRSLERYLMARALAPRDYRPAYNRGLVLMYLRRDRESEAEFTDALARNPDHADSYWHRALARRRLGDARGAADDLTRGLEAGLPRLSALLVRADLYDRLKDTAAAAADRAAMKALEPRDEQDYLTRGLLRMRKEPAAALADFDAALKLNPRSLVGWQNKAVALGDHLRKPEQGLEATAKAVELYPEYGPVRMNLAVLLARLGRRAEAHREAGRALVLAGDPKTVYQAANVYALTSAAHPEDREASLTYLRQALREGFREFDTIEADADMANVRDLPEFGQAIRAARELTK